MTERQLTPDNGIQLANWCGGDWDPDTTTITIRSREGAKTAHVGDWIIDTIPGNAAAFRVVTDDQHRAWRY